MTLLRFPGSAQAHMWLNAWPYTTCCLTHPLWCGDCTVRSN